MKLNIIKSPVVTEKSLKLANEANIYTFEVDARAHKNQIKETIEELYSVKVLRINTVMRAGKIKRTGKKRMPVTMAKTKKALVQLPADQSIEIFDLGGQA